MWFGFKQPQSARSVKNLKELYYIVHEVAYYFNVNFIHTSQ